LTIITFTLLSFSIVSLAQVDGDYRTIANGNWNANTTWEVRSGGSWDPCVLGDYPGVNPGAGTITIRNNNSVNLNFTRNNRTRTTCAMSGGAMPISPRPTM
jgi:hypothetical protein